MTEEKGTPHEVERKDKMALEGVLCGPPIQHQVAAHTAVTGDAKRPLVHMVCWDANDPCKVEVAGRVTLAGDEKAPLHVAMQHRFEGEHRQVLRVEPVEHQLQVATRLADPIHHALQMRTPLQVRFCNPWHVASDYTVEVRLGDRRLISISLRGATVATPQPCAEEPCPPGPPAGYLRP
jgi:hypothetical protein